MSSGQPGDGQSDHNLEGGISITPIEINLKSALSSEDPRDAAPASRPRVQFSDKVQRFPESVPTSPNPLSPKSEESKKFPIEPQKVEVPIRQVDVQRPAENGHSPSNGAPQIENVISVQHNAPYSAGPHHDLVIECEQLPSKTSEVKPVSQPSPEWSARAIEPKPLMTNVVLNIEIVRTQKESPPEDEDDEVSRVSFSLPAYNAPQGVSEIDSKKVQSPTTKQPEQQLLSSQERFNQEQATAADNQVHVDQSSANLGAEKVAEKVVETVVEEVLGEKLHRIDLTPLLNKEPDTSDVAIRNAEANRNSPLPEGLNREKKDTEAVDNSSENFNRNEKIIEIPITVVNETTPFNHEAEVKNIHGGLPVVEDVVGDSLSNDKFIEIPVTFEDSTNINTEVSGSSEAPKLEQFASEGQLKEIPITYDDSSEGQLKEIPITYDDSIDEQKNDQGKYIDIPITFESGTYPFVESEVLGNIHKGLSEAEPLPDEHVSNEKLIEIKITFEEEGQQEKSSNDNDQLIEIPVSLDSSQEAPKEVSSTEQQQSADQWRQIPIIVEGEQTGTKDSSTNDATVDESLKTQEQEKLIEVPITFESETVPFDDNSAVQSVHKGLSEAEPLPDSPDSRPQDKLIEIPVQFEESKPEDTGNQQQEKLIDVPITFESETVPFDDNSAVQNVHKGLSEAQPLPDSSDSSPQDKLIEIPVQFEESKPEDTGNQQQEKLIEVPITFESETIPFDDNSAVQNVHKGLSEAQPLPDSSDSSPQDKLIEIPVTFEEENVENKEPEEVVEIPVTVTEPEPPKSAESEAQQQKPEEQSAANQPINIPVIQISKPEENKPQQPSQPTQSVEQPQQTSEPITVETFETPVEKPQEPPVSTSPVTVVPPSEPSNDGISYQSSFAKPLFEENKSPEAEKVNVKPNEVVYQSNFARPMSQEPSPTEKKPPVENFSSVQQPAEPIVVKPNLEEKKSEEPIQQGFAKPLLDDSNKSQDSSVQTGFAKPLLDDSNKSQDNNIQTGFAKPLYEEPKKNESDGIVYQTSFDKPLSEVSKPDEQQKSWGSSSTEAPKRQQDSQPPTPQWQKPTNQWLESYDDGQTIWDKPTTGVTREIPITIQTGRDSSQQGQEVPQQSAPSQQSSSTAQKEPSTPNTFVSSDILYYEVPPEGDKSQQGVQQPTPQESSWGSQNTEQQSKPSTDNQQTPKSPGHDQRRRSDEVEINIKEYEDNLRKNTQEALQLVDKLVESSQKIQDIERQKREIEEKQREQTSREKSRSRSSSRSRSVQFSESALMEAQSYKVNPDLLKDANSVVMLPEYKIAIADFENGLTLFNLYTKDVKRVEGGNKWRNPQCLIYNSRAKEFFVLVEYSEKEDGKYERYILRFNQQMDYINRVEAPKLIADKDVSVFRMCYCPRTGCLYLAASTYASGYLYELSPEDVWTEIYNCRNKIFTDIAILAVVGPVTELLVLESTRSYVNIVSVYGTEATHIRMLAVCERPGTFCIDEVGHLIVHDRASSKISFHSRISFLKTSEIALVDHANVQMSAWDGLLAVLCPLKKDLRIYKY